MLPVAENTRIDPERLVHVLSQPALGLRVAPDHKIYAPAPQLSLDLVTTDAHRHSLENLTRPWESCSG